MSRRSIILSLILLTVTFVFVVAVWFDEIKSLQLGTHLRWGLPDVSAQALKVQEALDEAFKKHSFIVFQSYNGKWHGNDGPEVSIRLQPDGQAHLTETAMDLSRYEGRYRVIDGTVLVLQLKNYNNWPPMYLVKDEGDLVLFPTDNSIEFFFNHQVRKASADDGKGFWPFRDVTEEWAEGLEN